VATITSMLLTIVLSAMLLVPVFFFGWCMPLLVRVMCLTILLAVFFSGLFFAIRKPKKGEIEADERDIAIQKVAAIISLVSVLVVAGISLIVANLVWGLNAAVPLWVLMLLFGALVVFIALVVYPAVILVQYGRGGKNE
jgi:hypothetical protein